MPPKNATSVSNRRRKSRYANESDIDRADEPLLDTPTGTADRRDPEDVRPDTPEDEGAPYQDVNAEPRGDITGRVGPGNGQETPDGLDETEEAIRREAEERPLGRRRGRE